MNIIKKERMKSYFLVISCLLVLNNLYGQHKEQNTTENIEGNEAQEESEHKYKVAVAFGVTHIPEAFEEGNKEDAVFVPTIGLDFFYYINHRWSVGLIADLELGDYIVDFNKEDLNREGALIISLLAGYELLPHWAVLIGGGVEFEENKNLAVLKVGTEYEFEFSKGWSLAPSTFFDFKEDFNTWSVAIAIGKRF